MILLEIAPFEIIKMLIIVVLAILVLMLVVLPWDMFVEIILKIFPPKQKNSKLDHKNKDLFKNLPTSHTANSSKKTKK